jgi:membrane peptidoglycan carboxypeptidase
MQFVRTVTGYREISLRRKAYEVFLAVLIQFKYSKVVILRSYLDCAFFGSHLIGVDKAAWVMFSLPASALDPDQAAILASMLVYPKPLNPSEWWLSMVGRRAKYGKALYIRHKESFEKIPR